MTVIYGKKGDDGKAVAREILTEGTKHFWGWETLPAITRSPRGKPEFADRPGHWFSISHSGGYALCALSDEGPVGVDIEVVRPRREKLKSYILAPGERESFDGSWEAFYRTWTLKESWCKREDIRLFPPRALETPPPCPYKSYCGDGWWGAVCCTGAPPEEILWL